MVIIGVNANSGALYAGSTIACSLNVLHIISVYYASGTNACEIRVDNSAANLFTFGDYAGSTFGDLTIGGARYGGHYDDVIICELHVYDTKLSDTDRTNIFSYLKTKWGTA